MKTEIDVQNAEIERLNAQVAMLTEVLARAEVSLCSFIGGEGWAQSDMDNMDAVSAALCGGKNAFVAMQWLTAHDAKVRDDALEEVAFAVEDNAHNLPNGTQQAEFIRTMKGMA